MRGHYRHTEIIAAIGPATDSREKLGQLIDAGVDELRLNMAHGTGEWVTDLVGRVREVSRATEKERNGKGDSLETASFRGTAAGTKQPATPG